MSFNVFHLSYFVESAVYYFSIFLRYISIFIAIFPFVPFIEITLSSLRATIVALHKINYWYIMDCIKCELLYIEFCFYYLFLARFLNNKSHQKKKCRKRWRFSRELCTFLAAEKLLVAKGFCASLWRKKICRILKYTLSCDILIIK